MLDRDAAVTPLRHDAGLVSLSLVARFHGKAADPEQLRHELALSGPAQAEHLLLAAKRLALKARLGRIERAALERGALPLPCVVETGDGTVYRLILG